MPYFTAVLARHGRGWAARDVEVQSEDDLDDVAERLRGVAHDQEPVLLVIEREDEWFAIVRVDGDEDPRVFLSDAPSVVRSPYGEVLRAEEIEPEAKEVGGDDEDRPAEALAAVPAGDADLLADLGVEPERLTSLCEEGIAPAEALAEVSEVAGFGELLDSLR